MANQFTMDDTNREPRINTVEMPMGARYYRENPYCGTLVVEVDSGGRPVALWYGAQQLPFVTMPDSGHVMPNDRNALLPRINGVMVSDRHVGTVVMTNQTNGKEHKD